MNIPKPLIVVIIVVVILGVVACTIGVARGAGDNGKANPTPGFKLEGLLEPPRIGLSEISVGSNCSKLQSPPRIQVSGSCAMTLQPPSFGSKKLEFTPDDDATVEVIMTVAGESSDEDDDVGPGESTDITIGGSDPVLVIVSCSCILTLVTH